MAGHAQLSMLCSQTIEGRFRCKSPNISAIFDRNLSYCRHSSERGQLCRVRCEPGHASVLGAQRKLRNFMIFRSIPNICSSWKSSKNMDLKLGRSLWHCRITVSHLLETKSRLWLSDVCLHAGPWKCNMEELPALLKAIESQGSCVKKFEVACGRSRACQLTPGQRKRRRHP